MYCTSHGSYMSLSPIAAKHLVRRPVPTRALDPWCTFIVRLRLPPVFRPLRIRSEGIKGTGY